MTNYVYWGNMNEQVDGTSVLIIESGEVMMGYSGDFTDDEVSELSDRYILIPGTVDPDHPVRRSFFPWVREDQESIGGAPGGDSPPVITPEAPANSVAPVLSGTAQQGSVLTTSNGTWNNEPTGYTYQWQTSANGTTGWSNIGGATSSTYTCQSGDVSNYLRCVVTATNTTGSSSANSNADGPIASSSPGVPSNSVAPAVTGTADIGSALTTSNGTWSNSPTGYTYQWQKSADGSTGWSNLSGATTNSYTILSGDSAEFIRCQVVASNGSGSSSAANSNVAGPVLPVPVNSVAPAVTGTAADGSTLTCSTGTWSNSPTTYAYQWQTSANGTTGWSNLSGQTASTHVCGSGDIGNFLRCQVTASNGSGAGSTASSAATSAVTSGGSVPSNSVVPVVTGSIQEGNTISSNTGTWSNTPTGYTYQWQRSDDGSTGWTNISGATSSTYEVASGDVGKFVRSQVVASNGSGSGTAASSTSEGPGTLSNDPVSLIQVKASGWSGMTSSGTFGGINPDSTTLLGSTLVIGFKISGASGGAVISDITDNGSNTWIIDSDSLTNEPSSPASEIIAYCENANPISEFNFTVTLNTPEAGTTYTTPTFYELSPSSVFAVSTGSGTTSGASGGSPASRGCGSITPTMDGAFAIAQYTNDGGTLVHQTGWTEDFNSSGIYAQHMAQATAAAITGSVDLTSDGSPGWMGDLIVLIPSPLIPAVTVIQSKQGDNSSTTPDTEHFSTLPIEGNTLVVAVSLYNTTSGGATFSTPVSVTDNAVGGSNEYTIVPVSLPNAASDTYGVTSFIAYATDITPASGTHTVTITIDSNCFIESSLYELSASTYDKSVSSSSTNGNVESVNPGSITPSASGAVVIGQFGVGANTNPGDITAGSGWTLVRSGAAGNGVTGSGYYTQSGDSAVDPSQTTPSATTNGVGSGNFSWTAIASSFIPS